MMVTDYGSTKECEAKEEREETTTIIHCGPGFRNVDCVGAYARARVGEMGLLICVLHEAKPRIPVS